MTLALHSSGLGKVMLLTKPLVSFPAGGREQLCKLNHDVLKSIYGGGMVLFELPIERQIGAKKYINAFRGHIDGLNEVSIYRALNTINTNNIDKVFVDGSNLGEFVRQIKLRYPVVEVITFFHNVEMRFFWGALKQSKSIRAVAVFIANYMAERKAAKYSNKIICLNERDSRLLQALYGRSATYISPMAVPDKLPSDYEAFIKPDVEPYALFVGGNFYANRDGITWFVKHVAPRVGIKICVVGKGFERFKDELELDGRVEVIGAVDSLSEWYLKAHFVIAPIFDGSGMKTKVAEALMFGKKVIGTPEAFSGYEDIVNIAGRVCNSADEFVLAIEEAANSEILPFDDELRALYERYYSYSAARSRFEKILGFVE